jgi:universal stress protein A
MPLTGPVLVGTDLSEAAEEALRQGGELARALASQLIVCHVIPEVIPDGSLFAELRRANLELEQTILTRARDAVQEQLDAVLGADVTGLDIALGFGSPHVGILAQAQETGAGVVVTGPGSVPLDVIRHTAGGGPVVGATDFSDPAYPGIRLAALEATRRAVPLHVIHALDFVPFTTGSTPVAAMPYLSGMSTIALEGVAELRAIAERRLDEILRDIGAAGVTSVVAGPASQVIVQYAESIAAQLVVVGTHGRSGLQRLTLGSTAAAVIESAPCSVLVTRLAPA